MTTFPSDFRLYLLLPISLIFHRKKKKKESIGQKLLHLIAAKRKENIHRFSHPLILLFC